jgi:hypothetical protein
MLPSGDITPTKTNNRRGGMNWLKIEMLSTQPKEAKILMVRYNENGQFGPRVEMKLALEGNITYLGVPPIKKDPRYSVLVGAFGTDENNWLDQRIHLLLEQNEFTEAYQIKIAIPQQKGKK